jgi:hypothetical protein
MSLYNVPSSVSNTLAPSGSNFLDKLTNRLIPKGKPKGIGGFVFDIALEDTVKLEAEITDHWLENNSAVNDHVAIKPKRIILRGLIGELVQIYNPTELDGLLGRTSNLLGQVPAYLGSMTPQAVQKAQAAITKAQDAAAQINAAAKKLNNVIGLFADPLGGLLGTSGAKTKQQDAFAILETMFDNKMTFTLETPYKFYENVVIENIIALQPEHSKTYSEFTVILKQLNFSNLNTQDGGILTTKNKMGRAAQQSQSIINKGQIKPNKLSDTNKVKLPFTSGLGL